MCTIWSVLHVNSVATGNFGVFFQKTEKIPHPLVELFDIH